jgi:microcystin-dependent protein
MVAPKTKHSYTSGKADGPDSTFVKPSDWNADHKMTVSQSSVVGARVAGDVEELPLVLSSGGDDGTIWTKQAIMDAIAAAVGAITPGATTGDVTFTMLSSKAGWLLLNGITIGNVGSSAGFANASALALFTLFWGGIGGQSWPIQNPDGTAGVKGASADADWTALKKIALPDARGRALVQTDLGAGVNTLVTLIGQPAGEQNHVLAIGELAAHSHQFGTTSRLGFNNGLGGVGGGASLWDAGPLPGTLDTGGNQGHNNVQPSLGMNCFIKL